MLAYTALLETLLGLLREQGDAELVRAFLAWVGQVLRSRRFRGMDLESLPRLEKMRTMLEETVREWTAEWMEQGREQGLEQGRSEERALLCRLAARKFDAGTAQRLAAALAEVADPERLAEVGDWIIECGTEAELLARVARLGS